jgi:hypothetical protein
MRKKKMGRSLRRFIEPAMTIHAGNGNAFPTAAYKVPRVSVEVSGPDEEIFVPG